MFDHLNRILFKTPDSFSSSNLQSDNTFVPFMIQRWGSMYSPEIATLLNQTSNRMWPILESKEMWYQYLHCIIPQCRFKRIHYIKKVKDTEKVTEQKEVIQKVASHLEISAREVSQYIELFNLKLPNEKSSTKST